MNKKKQEEYKAKLAPYRASKESIAALEALSATDNSNKPDSFSETTLKRIEEWKIFLALNPIPEEFLPKRSKA